MPAGENGMSSSLSITDILIMRRDEKKTVGNTCTYVYTYTEKEETCRGF